MVVALSLGAIGSSFERAIAQPVNPQDSTYQENEYDAMGSSSFGNSFNPLDLIHRSTLSNGPSSEEFTQDSQQNLNNAADEFKRQQQERINQSNSSEQFTSPDPR